MGCLRGLRIKITAVKSLINIMASHKQTSRMIKYLYLKVVLLLCTLRCVTKPYYYYQVENSRISFHGQSNVHKI